jgi:hypothetical protein
MKTSIFAVFALLAIASALRHPFNNCGTATDPVTVSTVSLTPDPPAKGTTLTVQLGGTTSVRITGGSCSVKVFCTLCFFLLLQTC